MSITITLSQEEADQLYDLLIDLNMDRPWAHKILDQIDPEELKPC